MGRKEGSTILHYIDSAEKRAELNSSISTLVSRIDRAAESRQTLGKDDVSKHVNILLGFILAAVSKLKDGEELDSVTSGHLFKTISRLVRAFETVEAKKA
jgi:hypothetical protein